MTFRAVILCVVSAVGFSLVQHAHAAGRIEITEVDILSLPEWDSSQLEVAGFYLGMSRDAAVMHARERGLRLLQYGTQPGINDVACLDAESCLLYSSTVHDYLDTVVRFSGKQGILAITIQSSAHFEHAPHGTLKAAMTAGRLKGLTYEFLNGRYSNAFRLKLLGPETTTKRVSGQWGDKVKDTVYVYSHRGFSITVSPQTMTGQRLELVKMSFFPPVPSN